MPKSTRKDAIPTGISLGRATHTDVIKYHRRIEDFLMRREGRRPSLSETMELLIKTGLEAVKELDFDQVIEAVKKREVPEEVRERARRRRAGVLGRMTDNEVENLLGKARRGRK